MTNYALIKKLFLKYLEYNTKLIYRRIQRLKTSVTNAYQARRRKNNFKQEIENLNSRCKICSTRN